jgi:WD40 repeat protein
MSKFATASADKSIGVFDAKSGELIKHYPNAHAMGIYDLVWLDDSTFTSASADNSIK